jgi:uncharacterized membrane protein YesL
MLNRFLTFTFFIIIIIIIIIIITMLSYSLNVHSSFTAAVCRTFSSRHSTATKSIVAVCIKIISETVAVRCLIASIVITLLASEAQCGCSAT